MEKRLIASRFTKSLGSYDSEAVVQRYIAEKMCLKLKDVIADEPLAVAEFGCGTGYYTKLLCRQFEPARLWLNDLCEGAGELISVNGNTSLEFEPGDMEMISLPRGRDLITGCSVIQWFNDPALFFERCRVSLKDNGLLAFSSFGRLNFREIKELTGAGLNYHDKEEYADMLKDGYDIICCEDETVVSYFESPREVLRHIRKTGVSGTASFRWSRQSLELFYKRYTEEFGDEKGVTLTYNPIYIIARKK